MHEGARKLLAACAVGDQRAWSRLVEQYSALVYSVPRAHRLPDADCDDVYQATFAALVAHVGTIRDAASLPKWLITTAQRECWHLTRARRATGDPSVEGEPPAPAPETTLVEMLERRQAVREAMRELGGPCERLLRALFTSGPERPYAEIARDLGIPVGSIGPTRGRCLGKLLAILGPRLGAPNEVDYPGGSRIQRGPQRS